MLGDNFVVLLNEKMVEIRHKVSKSGKNRHISVKALGFWHIPKDMCCSLCLPSPVQHLLIALSKYHYYSVFRDEATEA